MGKSQYQILLHRRDTTMEYVHRPQLTFETPHQSGPHKICGPRDHSCCTEWISDFY